jgi:hypothetical protein
MSRLLFVVDPRDRIPTHVSPDEIDAIEYVDDQPENVGNRLQ